MFDERSRKYKNQYVPLNPVNIDEYAQFIGQAALDDIKFLAEPLKKKVWANINSTFIGGGVAEMLQSVIPFARGLGIDARWFVVEGSDDFFSVTKKFHNLLQGVDQEIGLEEIFHAYLDTIDENTREAKVVGHMVTVHDPQPAALIMNGNIYGHLIWRCHIDTSSASKAIWRFLLPYINHYEGIIFTAKEFMKGSIQVPTYEISPGIDPLRVKNKQRSREEALRVLSGLFNEKNIDPERPIIAAVSRYDIHKNQKTIIRAFKMLKDRKLKTPAPVLILVGNSASDDPEGSRMYEEVMREAKDDPDIYFFLNVDNNDEVVGSLMAVSECFVHISTKEGFGLVVSEAMWQGTPVIGSRAGGIVKQVIDGYNGMLVNPLDANEVAKDLRMILEDKAMRDTFSTRARETVRQHFLLPYMVKKELALMRYSLEIDNKVPEFRINNLTYKEINQALYGRTVWPFSTADLKQRIETILEGLEQ